MDSEQQGGANKSENKEFRDRRKSKGVTFMTEEDGAPGKEQSQTPNMRSKRSDSISAPQNQFGQHKASMVSAILSEFRDENPFPTSDIIPLSNRRGPIVDSVLQDNGPRMSVPFDDGSFEFVENLSSYSTRESVGSLPRHGLSRFDLSLLEFRRIEIAKAEVRRSLSRVSTILSILSIIAVCLMVVDVEFTNRRKSELVNFYVNGTARNLTDLFSIDVAPYFVAVFIVKTAISFDSILTVAALYYYYDRQCRLLIIKHHLPENATVLTSPLRGYYLVELFICAFHVPPLVDMYIPSELQLIIFLRFYLTARYMREHNEMAKSKSTRFLASVMQTELHSSFLIKTYFLRHPFVMIFIFYCLNIFGVGYAVFAFDRAAAKGNNYNEFQDAVWMLVVTMTTLGFGDVSPDSLLGRTLVGISSIFGIFLMALLISVIHEGLTLTQQEKRILAYVERQEFSKQRKDYAARCIQATWRLYQYQKVEEDEEKESLKRHRLSSIAPIVLPSQQDKGHRLKFQLYNALYNWRAVRKGREDHWVREFVSDNTAIVLTDVARKIELIEEDLARHRVGDRSITDATVSDSNRSRSLEGAEGTSTDDYKHNILVIKPASRNNTEGDLQDDDDDDDGSVSPDTVVRHIKRLDDKLEEMYYMCKSELHALHSIVETMSYDKNVK